MIASSVHRRFRTPSAGLRWQLFLGTVLAVLASISLAAPGKRAVELSELNASYERGQPVHVTVRNVGPVAVRVYASLEVVDEDGAIKALPRIYTAEPGQSASITFDVQKIELPPIPDGQKAKPAPSQMTFRFRVVVLGLSEDERLDEFPSDAFVVKQPYARP